MLLTLLLFSSLGFIKFCEIFVACICKCKKLCKYKEIFKNKSKSTGNNLMNEINFKNKSKSTGNNLMNEINFKNKSKSTGNNLMNGINYII